MATNKDLKVVFAPGCFDDFEGTQEELAELIAKIHEMAASGEITDNATLVDVDDLDEELIAKFNNAASYPRH